MKTFKLYMKIIKSNILPILIYLSVFIVMGLLLSFANTSNTDTKTSFQANKVKIAVFDNDNTDLSKNLIKELEKISEIVDIEDNETIIKDEMFFQSLSSYIRIEEGFTEDFITNNKTEKIMFKSLPDSMDARYMTISVNNYLNTIKVYLNTTNITLEDALNQTVKDLEVNSEVEISSENSDATIVRGKLYLNFASYMLLAVLTLGISITMNGINQKNVKNRMVSSPIRNSEINFGIIIGHLTFSAMILGVVFIFWMVVNPNLFSQVQTKFYILNIISITIGVLGIGFLLSSFLKSKNARTAASNVVSLALSFISGVFIPLELLTPAVITIAKFTPVYWYVFANNNISSMINFDFNTLLEQVYKPCLIQLLFGITFFAIALVINKNKKTEE